MKKAKDQFGDRMKKYEELATNAVFMPRLPVVCRLDGRGFSRWTKGLQKPYDVRMSRLMIAVTKLLVRETSARVGYTQSDEITLVMVPEEGQDLYFGARIAKVLSVSASAATQYFTQLLPDFIPEKVPSATHAENCDFLNGNDCNCKMWEKLLSRAPMFDARAFAVPDLDEAANAVLWREQDATRNSINGAAHEQFGHSALKGKKSTEKMEMLFQVGINWNDYPSFFKKGTYVRRKFFPDLGKSKIVELNCPPLRRVSHAERKEILFGDFEPFESQSDEQS